MSKRVEASEVISSLSKRELGKVIERTLDKEGRNASKRSLARRFQREARRKLGWVRISDSSVRD